MAEPSIDISYAYAQLGLAPGALLEDIQAVLTYASASRLSTKARLTQIRQLVDFFVAREKLARFDAPFADIKKAYHDKAKALHPDRNKGEKGTEEQLKETNAAYERVDAVNRQAKAYYKQDAKERNAIEEEARRATESERPAKAETPSPSFTAHKAEYASYGKKTTAHRAAGTKKYLAASVPRTIRSSRLAYLPTRAIIGSKATQKANDLNLVFDFIMLPEVQFFRARSYLAAPEAVGAGLGYEKFSPPYLLKNIKEVIIPSDEDDPEGFAKSYFRKEFGL